MKVYITVLYSGKVVELTTSRMNSDQIEVEVASKPYLDLPTKVYYYNDENGLYTKDRE